MAKEFQLIMSEEQAKAVSDACECYFQNHNQPADAAFDVHQVLRYALDDSKLPRSEHILPKCITREILDPVAVVAEKTGSSAASVLAARLNNRGYLSEMTKDEEKDAKAANLVVVFGYSDDNIEFRGAVNDELGCWCGGSSNHRDFYISREGFVRANEDDKPLNATGERLIRAFWCDFSTGASWSYQTNIPHETFNIYEDGELFCIGMVFSLNDI